ncbi:MAG: hypothetical protein AAFY60_04155, partial [Myxococcota bacterium]
DPGASKFFQVNDEWHVQMSEYLANEADDVLNELGAAQADFEYLLAVREGVWTSYLATEQAEGSKEVRFAVAKELQVLDQQIELALIEAQKRGCLKTEEVGACDWSPRRYADMVSHAMLERRQSDLSSCLRITANDFSEKSFIRNAKLLELKGLDWDDYTVSPSAMDEYISAYETVLFSLPLPFDPSTGMSRRGESYSDGGERGDRSTFAGAVSYGGEWEATWGSRFCDAEIGFGGHATLSAWAFRIGGEIAHLEGSINTDDNHIELFILARFAGIEVYRNETRRPAFLDFQVANPKVEDNDIGGSATFVIVFVPVTVEGGISVDLGIEFRLGGAISRDCSIDAAGIDLIGTVKPYGGLKGYASVAIGIPKLRVGVRGEVLIARVDLPLRGSAGLYLTSSREMFLRLRLSLHLQQRYLDGKIKLFGELGPLKGSVTIVSWKGFGGPEVPLFDESVDVALATL